MFVRVIQGLLFVSVLLFSLPGLAESPGSFYKAKQLAKEYVYYDRNRSSFGTLYCGCQWDWVGKSGGRIDLQGCGFSTRARPERAERIEYEHIVPAHSLGHQRQCWQQGGRKECVSTDPVFQVMHVDLYNLTPTVGEFNADRSNYRFSQLPAAAPYQHGQCPSRIDFSQRVVDPRPQARGLIARTYFYMHDRYDLPMSRAQQQLLMAWDRQYPVNAWELERNRRIASVMGHSNPFVTGEKRWSLGHDNEGSGILSIGRQPASYASGSTQNESPAGPIHGNRNSRIYHLPEGCPSYNAMASRNRVMFSSEQEALNAGYRKARNCR